MIKFEHTIYALPFAFIGAVFAAQALSDAIKTGWILPAMVPDLSWANTAFFTINGWISVLLFVASGIDILRH